MKEEEAQTHQASLSAKKAVLAEDCDAGGSTLEPLLSEKQAAQRLGIARISLLRARQKGRVRFYRIGTRVLFSQDHLREFLARAERNGPPRNRKVRDAQESKMKASQTRTIEAADDEN
jgi:excisionase family DNA binding protein